MGFIGFSFVTLLYTYTRTVSSRMTQVPLGQINSYAMGMVESSLGAYVLSVLLLLLCCVRCLMFDVFIRCVFCLDRF
jgi:hypothetical protein